ncbi:carbohydrate ABC transporter substrate-binding protein, CUT1 family [Rathayibacter oskolensis]|uniref:Carbohydrate ABC transporter substrate-binding protein, CUT1 family n=1 Tax=Rathayibacter oskolensis TaxID=1891671 RepID=A0A1X7MTQ6_9MICO|nr:extracellular solute-binding protein [Rathayibacter oskolensis]SMH28211.1 carbohydrate ABC transporter substrate-binding protein, CUT1 family [Rathayibacter oskolensis]
MSAPRLLAVGALALSSALLLSACSGSSAASDPDASVAAAAAIDSCDPAATTISAVFGQQATEAMTVAAANLQAEYPGLTIDATPQQTTSYDELTKQIVADIAVGKRPDVIMTGLGQLRFWVDTYAPMPIDPSTLPETYQSQFLGAGTVDDTVYLAPAQISAPVLLVNEQLADEAGVDAADISTLDELVAAAEKVTAVTGSPSVTIPTDGLADWFGQAFVQGSGGTFVNEDGTAGFGDDTGVEALSIWSTLGAEKLELGVGQQDAIAQFAGGNAAFMVTTTSLIATMSTTINGAFDWTPVDLPSVGGEGGALPAGGNGWVVLSEDACQAAFSSALVSELLSTEAVLKASGTAYSYIPVDSAAAAELLASDAATPQLTYAWSYDKDLTPWGGFAGDTTVQVNDTFRSMAQRLATGADAAETVGAAVTTIDGIVGK